MKKILVILAACAFMVSCQWWHETFSSPEDCAVWYCEQIAAAGEEGDEEKVEALEEAAEEWMEGLDKEDQEKAQAAAMKWALSNIKF